MTPTQAPPGTPRGTPTRVGKKAQNTGKQTRQLCIEKESQFKPFDLAVELAHA